MFGDKARLHIQEEFLGSLGEQISISTDLVKIQSKDSIEYVF